MAVIHPKWRTPAFSLIGQGIWAAALAMSGRYDQLYTYVIFGMVLSYTLTVIGLFVLRWKKPDIPRPYRCTGYPWLPAIYVLVGVAWTLNTIITRPTEAFWGATIVAGRHSGILVLEVEEPQQGCLRFVLPMWAYRKCKSSKATKTPVTADTDCPETSRLWLRKHQPECVVPAQNQNRQHAAAIRPTPAAKRRNRIARHGSAG